MTNNEAADMFLELADLLDLAGELPFKSSSYRKVANSLQNLKEPFQQIVKDNEFEKIPGTGKAIKEKLVAMALTGKLPSLEKWRQHEMASFYPWVNNLNLNPRSLGTLIRKLEAHDFKDLLQKLKNYDIKSLTNKAKDTAAKIIESQ